MTDIYAQMLADCRAKYPEVTIIAILGYNPQRLLTDQRSSLRKFVDGATLGEPYVGGKLYPHQEQIMRAFESGGEFVIPKTSRRIPHLYPGTKLELLPVVTDPPYEMDRLHRHMAIPKHVITVDVTSFREGLERVSAATERFNARLKEHMTQMPRWSDRMVMRAIYGAYEGDPNFARECRIAKLMFSSDRRQRKRGDRLFAQWCKSRPSFNFQYYRKD